MGKQGMDIKLTPPVWKGGLMKTENITKVFCSDSDSCSVD